MSSQVHVPSSQEMPKVTASVGRWHSSVLAHTQIARPLQTAVGRRPRKTKGRRLSSNGSEKGVQVR